MTNITTYKFDKHNLCTYVDIEDSHILLQYKWNLVFKSGVPYVFTSHKGKTIYLAREVLKASKNLLVDHIDGNTLNNTKRNLRFANKKTNAQNMKANKNSTSIFKGVCWDNNRKKWRANIKVNDKQTHLGRFVLEIDAAIAYNEAAIEYFGEFARLNEI